MESVRSLYGKAIEGTTVDDLISVLERAVAKIEGVVQTLGQAFPRPEFLPLGNSGTKFAFRHAQQNRSVALAAYCKAVNLCSLLGATAVLLRSGHMHEANALCRVIDEQGEDILFLTLKSTETSNYREKFLKSFYQEEFADVDDPLSTTDRPQVPRQKVRAAIFSKATGIADPSTAVAAASTITSAQSGYIHGAYVHIMDLYGGDPPRFHTSGLGNTPRMAEALRHVPHFIYRSGVAIAGLCVVTGNSFLRDDLDQVFVQLETAFPYLKKA
jgi:hypothetical protein